MSEVPLYRFRAKREQLKTVNGLFYLRAKTRIWP